MFEIQEYLKASIRESERVAALDLTMLTDLELIAEWNFLVRRLSLDEEVHRSLVIAFERRAGVRL